MSSIEKKTYLPIPESVELNNQLFTEYKKLHGYFGRGKNQVMEKLKKTIFSSVSVNFSGVVR